MTTYERPADLDLADAPWHEIIPGLWQGGQLWRDTNQQIRLAVVAAEFDLVITLHHQPNHGPAEGVKHLQLIIPDGALLADDAGRAEAHADAAAAAIGAGKRVLIRCQAGYNRSGLITALTLLRLGHDVEAAIDLIRGRRSRFALFNAHFLEYLRTGRTS